jgi:16S rRNA (uracil1498-N3)-methyltransferase
MQFFYSEHIETKKLLSAEDSKHCIRVLRKKKGDTVSVVDGKNNLFLCQISSDIGPEIKLDILEHKANYDTAPPKLVIGIAPTKNMERIEWMLEKAVEIGIEGLILLKTAHTVNKFAKTDRLRKIAISAMKQSLKATLPFISGPISIVELIASKKYDTIWLCHQHSTTQNIASLPKTNRTLILIGPEGDFSKEELSFVSENGCVFVSLGRSRLRTETAGLVAATLFNNT